MATLSPEQKRKAVYKAALQAAAKQRASEVRPDFFRDFLPHVKILTNEQELAEETQVQAAPQIAPFELYDYQRDMIEAWLSGDSECILKGRQIGISWCDAVYTLYRAVVDKWSCGFVSYKENVARWHLRNRIKFIWDRLPDYLDVDGVKWPLPKARWNADSAEFDGAGSILIFPSTPDAGVGYTFQKVTMDEFAFHDYAMPNYEALRPALPRGAQFIIFSTSNPELGEYGPFKKMWDSAKKRGFTKRFLPWNIRPEHTPEYYREEKDAYEGSENQFKAFHPLEENDAFTGKSGLVFPMFIDGYPHVQEPSCDWAEYKFRVAGIDPGGGDPTAIVPLGITNGWVFEQPYEFYTREVVTLNDIADWLLRLHERGPFDYVWVDAPRKSSLVAQLAYQTGIDVRGANKDKGARLSFHKWALEQRRLRIAPDCVNSRAEYAGYMFPERTDPNTKDKYRTSTPVDHHADACFVAGTMIATEHGERPIEDICPGDRVWTRNGLRPVLEAGSTGVRPVWQLITTYGALTGTPNHPVYVPSQGFTRLDALGYGDILEPCSASTGTTTASEAARTGIRRDGATAPLCTGMCGSTTTAPSQMDGTSITSTATPTTTTSAICERCRRMNIMQNTLLTAEGFPLRPSPLPSNGIAQARGETGMHATLASNGNSVNLSTLPVSDAAMFSRPSNQKPSTAPSGVRPLRDETLASMMNDEPATSVEQDSCETSTPRSQPAPVVVQAKSLHQNALVYNLTVADTPEFYANGILVHNCDARGYAMLGAFEAIRRGTNAGAPAIEYNRAPKHNDPWEARKKPPGVTFTRR